MKFTCLIENLKKSISISEKITSQNITLPILSYILLTTDTNKLKISATDLELGLNYFIPGKVEEKGSVLIPSRIFANIINNFEGDKITLEVQDNKLTIQNDKTHLVIQGGSEEEFPIIPNIDAAQFIEINSKDLLISLNQVLRSAGAGLSKPELNSVYCYQQDKDLYFVTTDTFRLSEKKILKNKYQENSINNINVIIPIKTAQELSRILQSIEESMVKIFIGNNQIFFDLSSANLISRLIEGEYIQYKNIIPNSFDTEGLFNKKELQEAIKLVSLFSSKVNDICLETNIQSKELIIKSQEVTIGQGIYKIAGNLTGEDLTINFNYRYLLDGLESIQGDKVWIGLNQDRPLVFKDPDDTTYLYITAPIKL